MNCKVSINIEIEPGNDFEIDKMLKKLSGFFGDMSVKVNCDSEESAEDVMNDAYNYIGKSMVKKNVVIKSEKEDEKDVLDQAIEIGKKAIENNDFLEKEGKMCGCESISIEGDKEVIEGTEIKMDNKSIGEVQEVKETEQGIEIKAKITDEEAFKEIEKASDKANYKTKLTLCPETCNRVIMHYIISKDELKCTKCGNKRTSGRLNKKTVEEKVVEKTRKKREKKYKDSIGLKYCSDCTKLTQHKEFDPDDKKNDKLVCLICGKTRIKGNLPRGGYKKRKVKIENTQDPSEHTQSIDCFENVEVDVSDLPEVELPGVVNDDGKVNMRCTECDEMMPYKYDGHNSQWIGDCGHKISTIQAVGSRSLDEENYKKSKKEKKVEEKTNEHPLKHALVYLSAFQRAILLNSGNPTKEDSSCKMCCRLDYKQEMKNESTKHVINYKTREWVCLDCGRPTKISEKEWSKLKAKKDE